MIIKQNAKVQFRYDTLANWSTANPVLLRGEVGVADVDGKPKLKIGDGTSAWNDLPFASTDGTDISFSWSDITGKPTTFTPSAHNHDDRYYTESEINTKLNSKSDTGHTHSQYLTATSSVKESYLSWGGKNFSGSYGCIDAAMVNDLGANRLMFGKVNGIIVEYSRDNGITWEDYGASDSNKQRLFAQGGAGFIIGKSSTKTEVANENCLLRISIKTHDFGLYTVLNKFVIYVTTNGSQGNWCTIDASYEATPTEFRVFADKISISGWSGYNVINTSGLTTYGNTPASQYGLVRFTFGCTGHTSTTYAGLQINQIMGFGGVGWSTPSTMAKTGHLYSFDEVQNATFPARVNATSFNGYTIQTSVPANAKFTDTIVDISGKQDKMTEVTNEEILAILNS